MKAPDTKAASITFGVELETTLPANCGLAVGNYHGGQPVVAGYASGTSNIIPAPAFHGVTWKAERDGSIRPKYGRTACEFVSPILQGEDGIQHLIEFIQFTHSIGASVNASCGCHITVGVASIIGTNEPQAMSEFARKLAHIARWHSKSLYGQTGCGRHLNHYSHTLSDDV